MNFSSS